MPWAKTEWAIINTKTGRLCPISDSGFPADFPYAEEIVCPEPLTRFTDDFTGGDAVYTHVVRASDTDFGGHMNNVAYVRALLDSFRRRNWPVCLCANWKSTSPRPAMKESS